VESLQKIWLPPEVQKQIEQRKKKDWIGFKGKMLWDWLQLLAAFAIPMVVAFSTLWFTAAQSQASDRASIQQHLTDLQTAQKQHLTDLQIANDQQQEKALQTYIDRISDLLLNQNLAKSKSNDEVCKIARARTTTLLPQLNGTRKGSVIRFLYEAGLLNISPAPIVTLAGADLSYADLSNQYLRGADLHGTYLRGADLSNANLNRPLQQKAS